MVLLNPLLARCTAVMAVWGLGLFLPLVQAQTPADLAQLSPIYQSTQKWLDQTVLNAAGLPLRMEVMVGELDPRLKLAPCERVDPYVPPGTQLWGKSRIGLRCAQGAVKWNVFLPITVKAFGPAWVIKGQVASGGVLSESDAMMVEVDWAQSNSPVVANREDWLGLASTRLLSTGQVLRQDMVKAPQVFQSGAQVRVLARGAGFEIATSAQAISSGVVGQNARVRMDNGHVVSGRVVDGRTVRLEL